MFDMCYISLCGSFSYGDISFPDNVLDLSRLLLNGHCLVSHGCPLVLSMWASMSHLKAYQKYIFPQVRI